jgi:hypothetical protein
VLGADGNPVNGTVNVNFEKLENGVWNYKNTAQPPVVNSYYQVLSWTVGMGHWRVRAVLFAQGNYLGSMSDYHEFDVAAR